MRRPTFVVLRALRGENPFVRRYSGQTTLVLFVEEDFNMTAPSLSRL
jgi:hypothetical protein